jgi:uncharacterized protein YqeY
MSLVEQINTDIKNAMKAKEREKLTALRDVKSKILLEATASGSGEVTEEAATKIVMKLHKQRMDTYQLYIDQERPDLAEGELFEAKVIEAYLPEMMSEDDIKAAVAAQIAKVGAAGPQDMGKVMGPLSKELAGKADGKLISSLVKEALNS